MPRETKIFKSKTIQYHELRELVPTSGVVSIEVGRNLGAALFNFHEFNERANTLFDHSIKWVEGNSISVLSRASKVYKTVNLEPHEYDLITKANVELTKALAKKVSLKETVATAAQLLITSIKDGNYGAAKV